MEGHARELALAVVAPPVIAAGQRAGISSLVHAEPVAPMPTGVEEHPRLPARVAPEDDRILAHVGREIVARLLDLGLVAEVQPAPRENTLDLALVDRLIGVDAATDQPGCEVDEFIAHGRLASGPSTFLRRGWAARPR